MICKTIKVKVILGRRNVYYDCFRILILTIHFLTRTKFPVMLYNVFILSVMIKVYSFGAGLLYFSQRVVGFNSSLSI